MKEYENWYMSMMHVVADFVVNGGGSYKSSVLELVKFGIERVEKEINKGRVLVRAEMPRNC
jgi:hypothetical protein